MADGTLHVISLFSGSRGNCTLIDTGRTRILIDAGGSAKAIADALGKVGYRLEDIAAVFVTHEHGDHTAGLTALAKKYRIPVHMMRASAEALCLSEECQLCQCLVLHEGEYVLSLDGESTVEAFFAPHDSVCCVGYRITHNGISVGIATDLGYVTQRVYDRLRGCQAVVLESNHDREMVKNGPYPAHLKRRILSGGGHLSNEDCAEAAGALARSGTRSLLLAHLSLENNTPDAACRAVLQSVGEYGVSVLAACPNEPTVLI